MIARAAAAPHLLLIIAVKQVPAGDICVYQPRQ